MAPLSNPDFSGIKDVPKKEVLNIFEAFPEIEIVRGRMFLRDEDRVYLVEAQVFDVTDAPFYDRADLEERLDAEDEKLRVTSIQISKTAGQSTKSVSSPVVQVCGHVDKAVVASCTRAAGHSGNHSAVPPNGVGVLTWGQACYNSLCVRRSGHDGAHIDVMGRHISGSGVVIGDAVCGADLGQSWCVLPNSHPGSCRDGRNGRKA